MSTREQYYNIFNNEGKLLQIEYGLEAANSGNPIVTLRSNETIVCVSKKPVRDKLEEGKNTSIFKVSKTCYMAITGLQSDLDYVVLRTKNIASTKSFNLGFDVSPDILCRGLADKMQKLTQSTGERPPAFNATIFGFDKANPMIYSTDISAICYPCFGAAIGEQYSKMTKYIEKNYKKDANDKELFEIAIGALLESVGTGLEWTDIEATYFKQGGELTYLSDAEIDKIIQDIAEKEVI